MAILYLDVDDEITSAAARVRDAKERRIAFVLPAGSRLGTSRINFRLLAREAQLRGRTISIVAPDAPTRSLAASAGLPTFTTVFEYEESLAPEAGGTGRRSTGAPGDAAPGAGGRSAAGTRGAESQVAGVAGAGASVATEARVDGASRASGSTGSRPERPGARSAAAAIGSGSTSRGQGRGVGVLLIIGIAVILIGAASVAGWLLLPSATVTVVARAEPVGPLELSVRADPAATATDPANLVVPAQRVTFPLSVSGEFQSTGVKVDETKATGSVRWTNCDPTRSYQIPAGTRVRTKGGTAFTTDESAFVAVATLTGSPPQITCQTRDVGVTAVTAGTDGNVGAGDITVVPGTYNSVVVRVTNPGSTSGGTHVETTVVDKKDVAAATKQLETELRTKLKADAASPANLPAHMTAFAETAAMTDPVPATDPNSLVDQATETFALSMTATGSVTVVDSSAVTSVAASRIQSQVAADHDLVDGSVEVTPGTPTIDGQIVTFPVTATARQIRRLDADALRAAIKGQSVDEAKRTLAAYGDVSVSTWPDWVSTIPSFDFRLAVTVSAAPSGAPGSPSPGAGSRPGTPSPEPSGSAPAGGGGPTSSAGAGASPSGAP